MVCVKSRPALRDRVIDLERSISGKYPDIHLADMAGHLGLRGTFPVMAEGQVIERFTIEITFPGGLSKLPRIEEVGGRIPKHIDRHVYADGQACTEVPELTLLRGYSLESYLDGPVRNYFIAQLHFEQTGEWPFGQWDHGKRGLLQAYGQMLGVATEQEIRKYLDYLGHKKIKGHWNCVCGSGKRLRDCHFESLRRLQESIPTSIARQALDRLNFYGRR